MLQTEEDLPSPSQEKSLFWLFPPLPETNENAMTTAEEADLKKRNQRRDDIRVYMTMATIVIIAALVTIAKIFVVRHFGLDMLHKKINKSLLGKHLEEEMIDKSEMNATLTL